MVDERTRYDFNRAEKRYNGHPARFLVEYCRYLENILSSFQIVAITINTHSDYKVLSVDYLSGSSNVLLEVWMEKILLPEVELLAANYNRQIGHNYITEKIVA